MIVLGSRNRKIVINVVASFAVKLLTILISLIIVPLTLTYLSSYEYGVWLTISSVLSWLDFFDVGLGNGLRNKLSESLAFGDIRSSRTYVSTTFFSLMIISITLFILFVVVENFLSFTTIFNVNEDLGQKISVISFYVVFSVCVSFFLKVITYVYFAKQLPVINNIIGLLSQLLSLLFIWILINYYPSGGFEGISIIYSFSPMIVLLFFYPITFSFLYKEISPNIKYIKIKCINQLLTLGTKFFLIQLSFLILYTASNIIISQVLSPDEVTPFNIVYKYFNCIFFVSTIVFSPMWNAVNEAYVKNELEWIKKAMKRMRVILLILLLVVIILISAAKYIILFWVGDSIVVPFPLILTMAIYFYVLIYSSLYSNFLNGMNLLNLQLYIVVAESILFIPLSYYLLNKYGIIGMALALGIVNLPAAIINHIQYSKKINLKAKGIWLK